LLNIVFSLVFYLSFPCYYVSLVKRLIIGMLAMKIKK